MQTGQRRDRAADAAEAIARIVAAHLQADLSLKLWDGRIVPLGDGARSDILLSVASPGAARRLLLRPRLMTLFELYGAGELAIEGGTPLEAAARWDHLRALALARNIPRWRVARHLLPLLTARAAPPSADSPGYRERIAARPEQGRDDRKLIAFHYDVSNAFYALFLDAEMVYSAGYFPEGVSDIDTGQRAKLDMICRRLRLAPGMRLLDIGCGWGGLACHAAQHFGVSVHGVTLSQEQFDYARAKVARLGLEGRVTIELRDYRTLDGEGCYDAIAQIEMFEHLGIDSHDRHFALMRRLLRMRGRYLHQASTRRATFDLASFRKPTAYQQVITRFIFPGGELDHIGMTVTNLERHGFEVHDVENWREHFQRTLELWTERLWARREEAAQEIGIVRTRLWLLYFSLFALAFQRGTCLVFQTLATKREPGPSGLPMSRADLY
jgi:cyclopropane-fatty-acyl-phospholipid synthase